MCANYTYILRGLSCQRPFYMYLTVLAKFMLGLSYNMYKGLLSKLSDTRYIIMIVVLYTVPFCVYNVLCVGGVL